MYSPNWKSK